MKEVLEFWAKQKSLLDRNHWKIQQKVVAVWIQLVGQSIGVLDRAWNGAFQEMKLLEGMEKIKVGCWTKRAGWGRFLYLYYSFFTKMALTACLHRLNYYNWFMEGSRKNWKGKKYRVLSAVSVELFVATDRTRRLVSMSWRALHVEANVTVGQRGKHGGTRRLVPYRDIESFQKAYVQMSVRTGSVIKNEWNAKPSSNRRDAT